MQHAIDAANVGIVMVAMMIGDELLAEKAIRPHGTFLPWLESNISQMGLSSSSTAQEYMRLSRNREAIEQGMAGHANPSIRDAFRMIGRGTHQAALPSKQGTEDPPPKKPRSKRAYAVAHPPADLKISRAQLEKVLDWYESEQLKAAFRQAYGADVTPKPRKATVRVTAAVKPRTKQRLEKAAKQHAMTQGQLIEQLLAFADQVQTAGKKSNTGGGDR